MRTLSGLLSLTHDAVDAVASLVQDCEDSVARTVRRVADVTPAAEAIGQVDDVRRGVSSLVHGSIHAVNGAVRTLSTALVPDTPPAPIPLRSDVMGSSAWVFDALTGAANGIVGGHLRRAGNRLDLGMQLRIDDVAWPEDPAQWAPGGLESRIVVLVHGLATTEWSWSLDAERQLGDAGANLGARLRRERGLQPVYVRYNTGLPVPDNGQRLAELLAGLVGHHPVDEIVLVGHSMGGLVLRSALDHEASAAWRGLVRRAVCLGSPHLGAPLEQAAHIAASTLARVDVPAARVISQILNLRSEGIRDLRWGHIRHEARAADPQSFTRPPSPSVPLVPDIAWTLIAGSLTRDPNHPVAQALGDSLVRAESALGIEGHATRIQLGDVPHHLLQVHPEAVDAVVEALG